MPTVIRDIDWLAERLSAAMPDFDPSEQALGVCLIRLLGEGTPAAPERLAETVGVAVEQVEQALDRWPGVFRDDHQRVIGYFGLTIREMGDHRLHVGGRRLSAWCAWDTLFLPQLLGETAEVRSRDPVTDGQISLTVDGGIAHLEPPETIVSFLVPEGPMDADVIQSFCHYIHFFASARSAERWTSGHEGTHLMSVQDAYELGQRINARKFGAALSNLRSLPQISSSGRAVP